MKATLTESLAPTGYVTLTIDTPMSTGDEDREFVARLMRMFADRLSPPPARFSIEVQEGAEHAYDRGLAEGYRNGREDADTTNGRCVVCNQWTFSKTRLEGTDEDVWRHRRCAPESASWAPPEDSVAVTATVTVAEDIDVPVTRKFTGPGQLEREGYIDHVHHWKLSAPDGPVVHQECECGATKECPAEPAEGGWKTPGKTIAGKPWTTADDDFIRANRGKLSYKQMADALGRSVGALSFHMSTYGLTRADAE